MASFRAQAIFRLPFGNKFPALKMIDFLIILMLDVPRSVEHPRQSESGCICIYSLFAGQKMLSNLI